MLGPEIIVRSLSRIERKDSFGNAWQYHPRSDRHSKIACWAMLFDLLRTCPVLVEQVKREVVGFGINHEMRNFRPGSKKNLDLVICTPGPGTTRKRETFADLVSSYGVCLTPAERHELAALPTLRQAAVGSVHLALEAKACMTAHSKARPRLYDELNSSHAIIHGSSDLATAVGFVMVNLADTFVSPDRNRRKRGRKSFDVTTHAQPHDAERTIEKVKEVPRRTQEHTEGYDALGIVVVKMANDGTTVTLVSEPPAPADKDPWSYDQMIRRMASLYASKFRNV